MPPLTQQPPVTLHLGAHRTGTTSLQRLLMRNAEDLAQHGVAVWGPAQTRGGRFSGIMGDPGRKRPERDVRAHRAAGRIALLRQDLSRAGVRRLVVSDENLLGGLRENLLLGRIYPTAAPRVERLAAALPGIDRVVLSIRSPDAWWTSVFAYLVTRGFAPPDQATIAAVLQAKRSWRAVIEGVASALPAARLTVWLHEDMAAQPQAAFADLTGLAPALRHVSRLNTAPTCAALQARLFEEGSLARLPHIAGMYAPFTPDERAVLRDRYDDDLAWLRAGADGLLDVIDEAPTRGAFRDRRPRHGQNRRQDQMGATG